MPRAPLAGLLLAALAGVASAGSFEREPVDDVGFDENVSHRPHGCASRPGLSDAERAGCFAADAEEYYDIGDMDGARGALREALRRRPGDGACRLLLAEALREEPDRALPQAEAAARSLPPGRTRARALRLAGELRADLDDLAGARRLLQRSLTQDSVDIDALGDMARLARGEPRAAAAYAARACAAAAAAPAWRRGASLRECARIRRDLGERAGALSALRLALRENPDDLKALEAMRQIRREAPASTAFPAEEPPRVDGAEAQAPPRARAARPSDDIERLRDLALAEQGAGRPERARRAAEALTQAASHTSPWLQLEAFRVAVSAWLALGDSGQALRARRRAKAIGREFLVDFPEVPGAPLMATLLVHAYAEAARARVELGDPAGAEATLERGLKRFPEDLALLSGSVDAARADRRPDQAVLYARRLVAAAERETPSDVARRRGYLFAAERQAADEGAPEEERRRRLLGDAETAQRLEQEIAEDRASARETLAQAQLELNGARPALIRSP